MCVWVRAELRCCRSSRFCTPARASALWASAWTASASVSTATRPSCRARSRPRPRWAPTRRGARATSYAPRPTPLAMRSVPNPTRPSKCHYTDSPTRGASLSSTVLVCTLYGTSASWRSSSIASASFLNQVFPHRGNVHTPRITKVGSKITTHPKQCISATLNS